MFSLKFLVSVKIDKNWKFWKIGSLTSSCPTWSESLKTSLRSWEGLGWRHSSQWVRWTSQRTAPSRSSKRRLASRALSTGAKGPFSSSRSSLLWSRSPSSAQIRGLCFQEKWSRRLSIGQQGTGEKCRWRVARCTLTAFQRQIRVLKSLRSTGDCYPIQIKWTIRSSILARLSQKLLILWCWILAFLRIA